MNERIRLLRKELDLSQDDFGYKLGVSRDVIKNIEYNKTVPKPAFVDLICERFKVSKEWLETGNGNMFDESHPSSDEQIADFIGDVLSGEMDIRYRLISVLSKLDPEDWKLLEKVLQKLKET